MSDWKLSRSYPYLSIARHFGCSYSDLLIYADFLRTEETPLFTDRTRDAVHRMNEFGRRPQNRYFTGQVYEAVETFKRIQREGW